MHRSLRILYGISEGQLEFVLGPLESLILSCRCSRADLVVSITVLVLVLVLVVVLEPLTLFSE